MPESPSFQALNFNLSFKTETSALDKAKGGLLGLQKVAKATKALVPPSMSKVNHSLKGVWDKIKLGNDRMKEMNKGWRIFGKKSKDTLDDIEKGIKKIRVERRTLGVKDDKGLWGAAAPQLGGVAMGLAQQAAPQAAAVASGIASSAAEGLNHQLLDQDSLLNKVTGTMHQMSSAARLVGKSLPFDPMVQYVGLLRGVYARATGQAIKDTSTLSYKMTHLGNTLKNIVARGIEHVANNWEEWISRVTIGVGVLIAAKVEDRVTEMMRHVNMSTTEVYKYMDSLGLIAGQTYASFDKVSEVMQDAINWGYRARRGLEKFVSTTIKLSEATGVAVGEMSEFVFKLEGLYKIKTDKIFEVAGAMKYVADNSAASMDRLLAHVNEAEEALLLMPQNVMEDTIPMMAAWSGAMESFWIDPAPIMKSFSAMTNIADEQGMRLLNIVATSLGKTGPELQRQILHVGGPGTVEDVFQGVIQSIREMPAPMVAEYRQFFADVLGMPVDMILKIRRMSDENIKDIGKMTKEAMEKSKRSKELMETWKMMHKTFVDMFMNVGKVFKSVLMTLGAPILILLKVTVWPFLWALNALAKGFLALPAPIRAVISILMLLMTLWGGLIIFQLKRIALTKVMVGLQTLFGKVIKRSTILEKIYNGVRAFGNKIYAASIGRLKSLIKVQKVETAVTNAATMADKRNIAATKMSAAWDWLSVKSTWAKTFAQKAYKIAIVDGWKYLVMYATGESIATIGAMGFTSAIWAAVVAVWSFLWPVLAVAAAIAAVWVAFKYGPQILQKVLLWMENFSSRLDDAIDYMTKLPDKVFVFMEQAGDKLIDLIKRIPTILQQKGPAIAWMLMKVMKTYWKILIFQLPKLGRAIFIAQVKLLGGLIVLLVKITLRAVWAILKLLPKLWGWAGGKILAGMKGFGSAFLDALIWPFKMFKKYLLAPIRYLIDMFTWAWKFLFGNTVWDFKGWISTVYELFKSFVGMIVDLFKGPWKLITAPLKAITRLFSGDRVEVVAAGGASNVKPSNARLPSKPGEGPLPGLEGLESGQDEIIAVLKEILAVLKDRGDGGNPETNSKLQETLLRLAVPLTGAPNALSSLTKIIGAFEG